MDLRNVSAVVQHEPHPVDEFFVHRIWTEKGHASKRYDLAT